MTKLVQFYDLYQFYVYPFCGIALGWLIVFLFE